MAAKVRAKQRHLASTAPSLLQFTSTRTATEKALKDAATAVEAALQAVAGEISYPDLPWHGQIRSTLLQFNSTYP